jgi:hypothetical protein
MDELEKAVKCYENALSINPHLDCLRQTISEIKNRIDGESSDPL